MSTCKVETALKALQRRFERADEPWPSLHHAFFNVGGGAQGRSPLAYFTTVVGRTIVLPLADDPTILDCRGTPVANLSAFWSDSSGNHAALRLFQELSLAVYRSLWPKDTEVRFPDFGWQRQWATDCWLNVLYIEGPTRKDPFLHVRQHDLEVDKKAGVFRLVPGYSHPIPKGTAVGVRNRRRRWDSLLVKFAACGVCLRTLEQGLFRASAYAIERILAGDWNAPDASPSVPTRDEFVVLQVLDKSNCCLVQTDIAAQTKKFERGLSRGTVGRCLARLKQQERVCYPNGPTKGAAITDEGRQLVPADPSR